MFNWNEIRNGNYVCEDDEGINITVFTDKNGDWRGIRDNRITEEGYGSAEEAMKTIEDGEADFIKVRPEPKTTDWKPAKNGGYYRYREGQILTAKQASSGKWFITIEGSIVRDNWFPSFEAAARYAGSPVY
jgi:hypothetical protein